MTAIQKKIFIALAIAQIAILGFMIAKREHLLKTGKTVVLKCEPIDPRSLFSGDYVILNYEISSKNFPSLDKDNFKKHETIYVALQQEGKYWRGVMASRNMKALKEKYPVVIRGVLQNSRRIRYGVESYFVPQSQGYDIERSMSQVSVEVSIADSGESAIKRIFIDDKEVKFY